MLRFPNMFPHGTFSSHHLTQLVLPKTHFGKHSCGRQNNDPPHTHPNVQVTIPRTCKYAMLLDKGGIKVLDGIKLDNQLTLK